MRISSQKNDELRSLWKSYVKGEKQAFGKLYIHYHKSLTAYCIGRLGSLALAENAASETLIKLMEYPNPDEIENFENWMFTVAKNMCTTHLTKTERRNRILKDNYSINNAQQPEVLRVFSQKNINSVLKSCLDTKEYSIWQLHQQGYENYEIAEQVGISDKTVANRKSMIRLKLKKLFNKIIKK